jgi:hypothetical protein
MTPSSSAEELRARAQLKNLSLDDLKPEEGLPLMFDFYKEVRADGCLSPSDRDMLVFVWGTYDRGEGMYFQLKIARQFAMEVVGGPEDGITTILHLTFYYPPTPALTGLRHGNRLCESTDELAEFISSVSNTAAYQAVASATPHKTKLKYGSGLI